ncbi:MAG: DUF2391 domain-containing protein [Aquificaceae bacterium]|nr:MAG: DUF2391 domain-containing protein [Aquificaceae bacterium]
MGDREKLKRINENLETLNDRLKSLEEEIGKLREEGSPRKLSLDDLFQELAGALIVALTMSLSEEMWELAQKLSWLHISFVFLFVLAVANFFVRYGNRKQWAKQTVLGFLQLRLLTSAVLSLTVSAFVVALLGIYPTFVSGIENYFKVVLFVASFSVIGSLGLDMAR